MEVRHPGRLDWLAHTEKIGDMVILIGVVLAVIVLALINNVSALASLKVFRSPTLRLEQSRLQLETARDVPPSSGAIARQ